MAAMPFLVKATCGRPADWIRRNAMKDQEDERARRLAQALRDNLRRRKAQARAATAEPEAATDETVSPPTERP